MKNKIVNDYLFLKRSNIHGKGIYAYKDIPKNTKIIEYIGELVSKKQGEIRADKQFKKSKRNKDCGAVYVFDLNKKYDLDGDIKDNYAKFINHSCNPNCRFTIRNNRIWIISRKPIKRSQEITYNYGYDLEDFQDHPCRCNEKDCLGFIIGEDYRKRLKNILKAEELIKNKEKI